MSKIYCPRAHSDMTPCAFRDGSDACIDDGRCVGCEKHAGDLLHNLAPTLALMERLAVAFKIKLGKDHIATTLVGTPCHCPEHEILFDYEAYLKDQG